MTRFTRTARTQRPALRGAFTALVTPFTDDGAVDETAFRRLVSWQVLAGIDGLVPCGTTGEAPTLSPDERDRLIDDHPRGGRPAARRARGSPSSPGPAPTTRRRRSRRPAGRPRSARTRRWSSAPYYNRPDQRMLEAHFRAVADEGDLPIVVYNVPVADRRRTSRPTRSCDSPTHPAGDRDQGGVGQPRADRPDLPRTPARTWRSWPATTHGPCRCSPSAATASCRSRATRSRARWRPCAPPPGPATGTRPAASTSAGCR